jgi:predicted amidohydrolase
MSAKNIWTIACVQMDVQLGQPEKNTLNIIHQLETAARKGARLIVFPECAITGYSFASRQQALAVATPLDSPHIQAIQEACTRLNVFAVVGTAEKTAKPCTTPRFSSGLLAWWTATVKPTCPGWASTGSPPRARNPTG